MKKVISALVLTMGLSAGAMAKEVAGVKIDDSIKTTTGASLTLNGAGIREKWMFDVYVGGLYLPSKSADAAKIINSDEPMAIKLHMLRNVSGEKMVNATKEGFVNATHGNTGAIESEINKFLAVFGEEASENNQYDMVYVPGKGVEVYVNGELTDTISGGLEFKKALFGIWLSDQPAQEDLKKDMLGG
ncbi:MAG: chalcone isomerase family protein [Hahellaceae bacterium]|nr:chalcone isomerase family protein [Hahellaceae bacterium]